MATRIIPQDFYVYLHRRATDNTVFYVGKGKGSRAWTRRGRNPRWHRTVEKYGYTVEIVIDGLQSWYALELEHDYVLLYENHRLMNLTAGGIGALYPTEEVRRKISETHKGKKMSAESRAKMSASRKGQRPSDATIAASVAKTKGKKLSPEHVEKLRQSHKGIRLSEEAKQKLSAHFKGRKHREEDKQKIRDAAKRRKEEGRVKNLSDDHKKKVGEAMKKIWQERKESKRKMPVFSKKVRSEETREKMRVISKNRPQELKDKLRRGNEARWERYRSQKAQAQLSLDF